MKFCKKCDTETARDARGDCKPCSVRRNSAYRIERPEKIKAKSLSYYAANKELLKAKADAWRAANKDKVRAACAAWNAAHPEKENARKAVWRAANKDTIRVSDQNLRAKRRMAHGKLTKGLAGKLFSLQRGKCACGCRQQLGTDYHLDHVMPLALGGTNTDDNMQLLRAKCNLQKYAKHPVDFMQQRGFLI